MSMTLPISSEPAQSVAQCFAQGFALHQAGDLDAAQALYEQVLQDQANHFDALHLLGVIALQSGQNEQAVALIRQAIEVNPNHASAHSNLVLALQALGQWEAVIAHCDEAIRLQSDRVGHYSHRAEALQALGRHEAAVESYDQAIHLQADDAQLHFKRGNALLAGRRYAAAAASYAEAIRLRPEFAVAHANRGLVLHELGQVQEALASYERALALQPDLAEVHSNRGIALKELGRFDAALASYDQSLRGQPKVAATHTNRGLVLQEMGRLDEALASHDEAIRLEPDYAEAYSNRGNVFKEHGQWAAALADYDRAIELQPDFGEAHWNKALALLELGDFEQGWRLYEWRWKKRHFSSPLRHFNAPLWLGDAALGTPSSTSLQGQTILLHAEQGLGDTIQFCRYAKQVAALGARVLLEVPPPLVALCQSLEGVAQVIEQGQPLPDFDCHCPLLSLPLAFKTTVETIPAAASYLRADAKRLAHWRQVLGAEKVLRVGLVWSGSAAHPGDHKRSLGLAQLLSQLPTHASSDSSNLIESLIEYISLQKEVREGDQAALAASGMRHFGDEIRDFADTAALCELVDVVISVDTSVAHLAGALGRPTWVLLPQALDWRWLRDREDSPWYPSMRLYRQSDKRDWSPVLARVGRDLRTLSEMNEMARAPAPVDSVPVVAEADVKAWFEQGLALHQAGDFDAARGLYEQVLQEQPKHFDALHLLGVMALQTRQMDRALALIDQAIQIRPNQPVAYSNRAFALYGLQRLDEALASCDQAIRLKPDYAEAYSNRANVLKESGQWQAAVASCDQAIALQADLAEAHWNRALTLLAMGDFVQGFREYEWRWQWAGFPALRRHFSQPLWLGPTSLDAPLEDALEKALTPLQGQTILLHAEQGFGDMVQFCRYAPQVAALGARVLLEVPGPLVALCQSVEGVAQVIEQGQALPDFDCHCPLMSLALAFKTTLQTIPAATSYLRADAERLVHWGQVLGAKKGLRVGLAWSGRLSHADDQKRSLDLDVLLRHLPPSFEYISLQKEVRAGDQEALIASGIRHFGDEIRDFADTAALCELVDVVISVDTSVAHLAGALGRPTWVLLPHIPDWRWLLDREDSPWYPSVRIYRQSDKREWTTVLERVGRDLQSLVEPAAVDTLNTSDIAALFAQGLALQESGQWAAALACCERVLALQPDHADAHYSRGNALQALGRLEAAVESYDRVIELQPDAAQAHYNRGNALKALEKLEAAAASYEQVTRLWPRYAGAHNNRGIALKGLKQWEAALASYDRAIEIEPNYAQAHYNRGNVLKELERFDEAVASHDRAIALKPDYAQAWCNRGFALEGLSQYEAALASYDRALAIEPGHEQAHLNQACTLLLLGRLEAAWPLYEWRWMVPESKKHQRSFAQALWLGPTSLDATSEKSLSGQTILLHAEQGFGDAIQFCRYAKQVASLGARVVLEVPGPLVALCQGLEGVAQVIEKGQALPAFDRHCPLLSLPLAFKTTLETIPAAAVPYLPYLRADAERLAHWDQVLGPKKGVRVGLVWSGSTVHSNDSHRSLSLDVLLRHLPTHSSIPVEYISLQKEVRAGDQAALIASGIRHFGDEIRDFADTAALCELVDVVISVDTSVAHLAGALGRPTWVLLPRVPDWRWLLDREDSPWYPSVRIYRQSDKRDWASVLERVGRDLQSVLSEPAASAELDVAALFAQGLVLQESGQWAAALACCDRVLALQPDHADAHYSRGNALQALGRLEAAVESYDRVIELQPDAAQAHYNRGNALKALEKLEEAAASYEQVTRLWPRYAGAHNNRGIALKGLKQWEAALASYDRAIEIEPNYAQAHYNRGNVLKELGKFEAAVASHDRAIALKPDYAQAWCNRGFALEALGQYEAALASYDRALAIEPADSQAHYNRGNALKALGQFEAAVASYDRAIALKPAYAQAWCNRGFALEGLGRFEAALASDDQAIAIEPQHEQAHWNKACTLLLLGRLEVAWPLYEWRWLLPESKKRQRSFAQALWLGETALDAALGTPLTPLQGQTILLHAEQGFGDAIQFCRYAKQVASLGARVVLEVPGPLVALCQGLEGVAQVIEKGQALPDFDCHCPLLSLPLAFKTTLETIPAAAVPYLPYLRADAERLAHWAQVLGPKKGLRIGLVWSGSTVHSNDRHRSLSLDVLLRHLPAHSSADASAHSSMSIEYISLQKEVRESDQAALAASGIRHFGDEIRDFSDTAALCELVDVVISVDTSVAHLAGALGRPTWVLLPRVPDWRWLLDREDSPWYPSVRLYRQSDKRDWAPVLERVGRDLKSLMDPDAQPVSPEPAVDVAALFAQGFARHQAGDFDAAWALYEQVLQSAPNHFNALHLLGVLATQANKNEQAAELIARALQVNPHSAMAYSNQGVVFKKLKRLDEAVASCNQAIRLQPDYAEAYGNRALALQELGQWAAALASGDQAIALQPDNPEVHYNRGVVLQEQGQLEAALGSYDEALRLNPGYAQAHAKRALALQSLHRLEDSLAAYDQTLRLWPEYAEVHYNRACALQDLGRQEEAIEAYEQAIRFKPDYWEACVNCGSVQQKMGQTEAAIAHCDLAIRLRPDLAAAHSNRGLALRDLGRLTEAEASCRRALALDPDFGEAHNNLGLVLQDFRQFEAALASCDRAVALQANSHEAHSNRSLPLRALGHLTEAEMSCRRALALDPGFAQAHNNLGLVLQDLAQLDAAVASFDRAIALQPDMTEAYWNKSLALLLSGDFAAGWPLYEQRWQDKDSAPLLRHFGAPLWLGETSLGTSLSGQTVLLHAEQGLGDSIQFCRYAKQVVALGARVVLEVPGALVALCQGLEGVAQVIEQGQALPDFDCHCPLMSLPLAFKTTLETIPAAVSYLRADAHRIAHWSQVLGAKKQPRVGLVWSGKTAHAEDHKRSLGLGALLAQLPTSVEYVSLQKEVRAGDQEALATSGIRHFGDEIRDFADTAALCELVDVVISVDTSVAHLAGALGRPTWVLLPRVPDWRWLLDREDSPWYPSVRLYRQSDSREWTSVLERVGRDLQSRLASAAQPASPEPAALATLNTEDVAALFAQGLALHQSGEFEAARVLYERVLQVQPNHFDALHLSGAVALQLKQPEKAKELMERAIGVNPNHASVHSNLGLALQELGQLEAALASLDLAIALKLDFADAHFSRGNVLQDLGRFEEAIASYDRALALQENPSLYNNRGNALKELGRFEEALVSYERSIALQADFAEGHSNRGLVLELLGRFEEAVASYDQALRIRPHWAEVHYNRGNALQENQQFDAALASYEQALHLQPNHVDFWINRGLALSEKKEWALSLASFDRAIACDPEHADAYWSKALTLLLRGDFVQGWPLYEWRWKNKSRTKAMPAFDRPLWLAPASLETSLQGKTLLLHAEQGFGDTIQFCRYAQQLAERGARVLLEVPPHLMRLLQGLAGVSGLIEMGQARPDFDAHCPLLSLPLVCQTRLETIPAAPAYLRADAGVRAHWAQVLGPKKRARKGSASKESVVRVGLAWSGNSTHKNDRKRSLTLAALLAHLPTSCEYISLQKEVRESDQAALAASGIRHFGDEIHDFADTAALCELVDVVISVDTSVVHLAGALGRPTWVLLSHIPDWRWLLDREDSPWYPSVKLYRQGEDRDWAAVLRRVAEELKINFQPC